MNKLFLKTLLKALIIKGQQDGSLPNDCNTLADELQSLVANEMYICKSELVDIISKLKIEK